MRKVILSESQMSRLVQEVTSYLPDKMYGEEPAHSSEIENSVSGKIDGFSTDCPTTDHIADSVPNNRSGYWRRKTGYGLFEQIGRMISETNNKDLKGGLNGAQKGKEINFTPMQLNDLRTSLSKMSKTDVGYDFGMNILKNGGKVSYQAYQKHLTDLKNSGNTDMTPKSVKNSADNQKRTSEIVSQSGRDANSRYGIPNRTSANPNTSNGKSKKNFTITYEN